MKPILYTIYVYTRIIATLLKSILVRMTPVGLGGLGVTCSPRDPRFAGSNPTEVDGFFQDVKILSTNPPGEGVPSLRFQAR